MKKMVCLFLAVLLCMGMSTSVFAYRPSISYPTPPPEVIDPETTPSVVVPGGDNQTPPHPVLVPSGSVDGTDVWGVIREGDKVIDYIDHGCLRITPLADLFDDTKEVPDVIRELLLFVRDGLQDESIVLPYEKFDAGLKNENMAVRDIYDIRWACEEHKGALDEPGVVIDLTFDMGFDADEEVYVLCYDEAGNDWSPIVKTVNNGDGTITCTFEHFCAFTFSVVAVSQEADVSGSNSMIWLAAAAAVVVVGAVVIVLKNKKKEEVATK